MSCISIAAKLAAILLLEVELCKERGHGLHALFLILYRLGVLTRFADQSDRLGLSSANSVVTLLNTSPLLSGSTPLLSELKPWDDYSSSNVVFLQEQNLS